MINEDQFKDAFKEILSHGEPIGAWEQSGLSPDELEQLDSATVNFFKATIDINMMTVLSTGLIMGIIIERQRWRLENDVEMPQL